MTPGGRVAGPGQADDLEIYEEDQLVLSDLINRVLDKGVVISAHVTISIADIDLIQLDLRLLISSFATLMTRTDRTRRADLSIRADSQP
ncbi:MAG: gas vesicle protein [Gemmatimonadaceae bacterium]